MELDIFFPSLSLAVEYQGEYHYRDSYLSSSEAVKRRDQHKREYCAAYGITLIEIPYWWEQTTSYLKNVLKIKRPDVQ